MKKAWEVIKLSEDKEQIQEAWRTVKLLQTKSAPMQAGTTVQKLVDAKLITENEDDYKTAKEEFLAYGLPIWSMYLVGGLKVAIAVMLIISIWVEELLVYNLILLAILMIAAVFMHVKVKDPLKKSYPALSILFMIALIMYITMG